MEPTLEDIVRIGWDFGADADVLYLLEEHLGVQIEPAEMVRAYKALAPADKGVCVRDLAEALVAQLDTLSAYPSFDSQSASDSQSDSFTDNTPGDFPRAIYPQMPESLPLAAKTTSVLLPRLQLARGGNTAAQASKALDIATLSAPLDRHTVAGAVALVHAMGLVQHSGVRSLQDTLQPSDQRPADSKPLAACTSARAASDGDLIELWPEHHCTLCIDEHTGHDTTTPVQTQGSVVLQAARHELATVVGPWRWEEGAVRAVCGCQEKVLGPSHSLSDLQECESDDEGTSDPNSAQEAICNTVHTRTAAPCEHQSGIPRARVSVARAELRLGKTLASSDRSVVRLGSLTPRCTEDTRTLPVVAKAYEPERVSEGVAELLVMERLRGWRGLPRLLGYRRTVAGGLQLFIQPYDQSLHAWATRQRQTYTAEGVQGWLHAVMTRFADVACLVAELHSRGVAHGDLKPHNMLVDSAGLNPVLADWGEAVMTHTHSDTLPQIIESRGTEAYQCAEMHTASPQQPIAACAGDVWSLGCSLYELITGELMFPGPLHNLRPMMLQVEEGRSSWLHTQEEIRLEGVCGALTSAVCDLLLCMLRPEQTRASAQQVLQCARNILSLL